jgi:hypothetical protein
VARIYLETSFFSLCASTRKGAKELGWKASSNEWWENKAQFHKLFISPEVVLELSSPGFQNRLRALSMLENLNILDPNNEVRDLARLLVQEHVMPGPATRGDAIHVATAVIHRMDYILTWNIKHLANHNKRRHMSMICMRIGYVAPMIVTPDFLQESNDD